MENIFDVGNYIADQARALPQSYDIEGIPFDLLSLELDDELLLAVKDCGSYNEMVLLAADNGLAYYDDNDEANRVIDNKRLAKKVEALWGKPELKLESDPCIKERVGEVVCEISGLSDFILAQLDIEKEVATLEDDAKRAAEAKAHLTAEGVIDGDNLPDMNTELGYLDPTQLAQDAINNAS